MQSSNKSERLFSSALLLLIIVFGVFIRVQNREALGDSYLFGTDSYRYFRQTRQIVETGELPRIDTMRNSPIGIDNTTSTTLYPFLLANAFVVVHTFFPNLKLYQFAIFFPIFSISVAALLLYALTNRLFGKISALFATLIFVSTPAILFTSSTGFVDTNATIILLFLAGISLYAEACQAQRMWKRFVYMFLSGITISFLGLIWNGVGLIIAIIVFSNFLQLSTKSYDKTDLAQYAIWLFPILVAVLGPTKIYRSQLFASHVLLTIGVPIGFGILASIFIGIQPRISSRFDSSLLNKVPLGLKFSVLFLCLGCIILTLTSRSLNWMLTLINAILYPFGKNGIMEFVSELQPLTFAMWREAYGLLLLFAIPGLCLLTYTRPIGKRKSFLLHCTLTVIAILGIAVSRFIPLFSLPIPWITDDFIFAISVTLIVANALYQFSFTTYQMTTDTKNENHGLLIFAWFIPSYVLTCSAIRFDLFLAPLVAMLSGYMLSRLFKKYMPQTENNRHLLIFLGVLLVWQVLVCGTDILTFLISIITFNQLSLSLPEHLQFLISLFVTAIFLGFILQSLFYRKHTQYSAKKACALIIVCSFTWLSIIGIYRLGLTQTAFMTTITAQPYPGKGMRHALSGVKTNTAPDAVIAANWTLGSIINELGKRTTIVDEEQNFAKIRAMSKAVFYGKSENEALQFLKEHRATHILLQPMDISLLNLHFFAASGQSENIERFIPVTPLKLSDKSDQKLEYLADQLVLIKINTEYNTGTVKKAMIPFSWEGDGFTISSPASITIHEDNSVKIVSVKELIIADRQWYFPEGKIGGCVWKRSGIVRDIPLEFTEPMALYISPEARESMAVKLFFGEHSSHFKLVYESPPPYGIIPIKIWEIQYGELPDNEK